ncbi:MAG: RNA-binding protein [Euryarchaeota archaeon]|nr:RNA-binding protein [Euryarchaeota archaeon]
MEQATLCTVTGEPLADFTSVAFPCPLCGHSIGRSTRCRDQAVLYACPECGFIGP